MTLAVLQETPSAIKALAPEGRPQRLKLSLVLRLCGTAKPCPDTKESNLRPTSA